MYSTIFIGFSWCQEELIQVKKCLVISFEMSAADNFTCELFVRKTSNVASSTSQTMLLFDVSSGILLFKVKFADSSGNNLPRFILNLAELS